MRKARGAHPFLAVRISEKGHASDTQNGGTKSDLVFLGFSRPTALKTIPREIKSHKVQWRLWCPQPLI